MHLKRLELAGFKSFSAKTKITLEPGISCIVGPNGSGKSNIADALRWVLGESSTRNIRAGSLADVIFSGSDKRRPLGMAEVSVIFDNSDHTLPLEFAEVSVTRRTVRGGGSEYFINDAPCRLKDLRDLLADSGVSVEGLTVINQGGIQELISARPEERRVLVEEAAGIVRFRDRKREAQRKLAETERHLERLGDIISELAGRIEPLHRQSDKAAAYLKLKEKADLLAIGVSVKVLTEAEEKISGLKNQIDQLEQTLLQDESERLTIAAEAEQLRLSLSALDESVTAANDAYYRLQTDRERCEGERTLAAAQLANSTAAYDRWQGELNRLEQEMETKKAACDDLAAHIIRTEQELAAATNLLENNSGGNNDLIDYAARLSEKQSELLHQSASLQSRLATATAGLEFQQQLRRKNLDALDKLASDSAQIENESAELSTQLSRLTGQTDQIRQNNVLLTRQLNEKQAELMKLTIATQELSAEEADCRFRCTSAETRLHMLTEMTAGYEGFFPGVKGLMNARRKKEAGRGVIGVVAELMDVPEQYRVAVEAYLGANLQNIVCEDDDSAKEAVTYLKQHNLGRATFLPLNILRPREAADFSSVLGNRGVHGRASELIGAETRVRPAIDFLLNNVLIADDLNTALPAAKKLKYKVSVVTLDGDLIAPGAAISGGSRGKKAGDLLSQKSRLDEAQQNLDQLRKDLAKASADLTKQRDSVAKISGESDTLEQQLHDNSTNLRELTAEIEQLTYRRDLIHERRNTLSVEEKNLRAELAHLDDEAAEADAACLALHNEEQQLNAKLTSLSEELAQAESAAQASQEQITAHKVMRATTEQKLRGQRISLEKLQADLTDLCWEAETRNADITASKTEIEKHRAAISEAEQTLKELGAALHDAGLTLEKARHGMAAENARLLELDHADKAHLKTQDKLKTDIYQLQLRRERWQADFENEAANLAENFQLDLEQAKERVGETAARTVMITRLTQIRREITALGNVNLDAIAEYQEVSERYNFLTNQRDDMLTAKARLNTVIREMDQIMTGRFKEAFVKLSAAFDQSFRRLFDGGHAELALSDPDNILETGVELIVNPPGKKVSNYSLLSGGEKSLVGIALLFALLTVKPTPFCLMDEVDAALDEANITRFTSYLSEKAAASQFVMISHRQTTMEAASALWGVTMEEEGVSKIISVRLTETA